VRPALARIVLFVVLVATAGAPIGAGSFGTASPADAVVRAAAPAPPRLPLRPVDVYGDSVLGGGDREVRRRLRREGWAANVLTVPGVSIEQVAAAVIAQPRVTDVVVLVLGYSYFWKPYVLRRDVDAVMYALTTRGARRVVWLDVRENRPERRDVNSALGSAFRRWGNLEIAAWDELSKSRSDAFLADGHHLTPTGGRLMGGLIARRLGPWSRNEPRVAPPRYGRRMPQRPMVTPYGAADPRGAGPAARRWKSRSPLVGIAPTRSGNGYWLVRRDGSVRSFGDARYHGSAVALPLRQPIVSIVTTRSGRGYWLVAADGGVFSYGDARFYGSTGALRLNQPVVGMARTPGGRGYWLVAADGGIFSFGDARFYGSTGGRAIDEPIIGMAAHPSGRGYWLVAYDGGIFTFGQARFHGSGATIPRYWKIVAVAPTRDGRGYWQLTANGEVLAYGSAVDQGWQPSLSALYVGIAPRASGGYWLAAQGR
jgi:hypothetical protein